ncbi:MAG: hypothetical protein VX444_02970 [Pseudomonadota bacterium]|nr:hypothetical protein [Pseudomonadota bacterium]
MKVIHLELLDRRKFGDNKCVGTICLHGKHGERIQVQSTVRLDHVLSHQSVNGILAKEAIRQLRRMPEHRGKSLEVSKHAMPRLREQRVIRLTG